MKKNRAINLVDLIPIVGEGTIIYRKFKYKSDDVVQEYKRCLGIAAVSYYHMWLGATFACNYPVIKEIVGGT